MKLANRFTYRPLERVTESSGTRYYICPDTGEQLSSVTTILDKTADKTALIEWRNRVGDRKADEIKKQATDLGSLMHTHLECFVANEPRPGGNNFVRVQAAKMADQIIYNGMHQVDEIWGSEVMLYYPHMWAGTTDLVGVFDGRPAIMDFKTARKMKTKAAIGDYFLQLTAYALAHDELFNTKIETGVIFMVDRAFTYKQFVIEGKEFRAMRDSWIDRLEEFMVSGADARLKI